MMRFPRRTPALSAALLLCAIRVCTGQPAEAHDRQTPPRTTVSIPPDPAVARFSGRSRTVLSDARLASLLKQKVKYVFVIYQENRSFDSYFGTFPGADGLFSQPSARTPGFSQSLIDTDGRVTTIQPFRIGPRESAADTDDIDHSHPMIVAKMDIAQGKPRMDHFALTEEKKRSPKGNPSLKAKQFGELAMAYEDGDTIPFLWRYANRFVLFDHIFQQMTGPSTPGNLAIIGAQTGATQWMRHPKNAYAGNGASGAGVPVLNDADPFWGSGKPGDTSGQPVNPRDRDDEAQDNLTYATLPLTLTGGKLPGVVKADKDPGGDLDDIREDIGAIGKAGQRQVPWGWFQEGYDKEPTDTSGVDPVDANGTHASYITHHNGPQYFGYIANNPKMNGALHGLRDFFDAVGDGKLPSSGGVFYVKGGYRNIFGLVPRNPDPRIRERFRGDDDHPAYSDSQISEAMVAEAVNRVAASRYWKNCAIIITWDDSEGDYDHVPPPVRSVGPDGSVITDGPRVPLLVISPYARAHVVAHASGDHASVVKFVDRVFGLTPLADLPDEVQGREIGKRKGLSNQGPYDDRTAGITDLLPAFDPARLAGTAPALPAWYAEIPEALIHTLPGPGEFGLKQIGVTPTDYRLEIVNRVPADFNPRPSTTPTR